ncbi:MAG: T9SS type A sorting domain-containing protein [Sphingobacteriaceae bacterium]|nr:T9SS type A sorting domain-containing protein [Sphingobacteriaceae bacterium]
MKKLFTIFLLYATFCTQAQGPVIEATYFPVVNTKIKQVWDITTGSLTVPGTGENKVWDYRITNGQFTNPIDTTDYEFLDPSTSPYSSMFPNATHVTYISNPQGGLADSMYVFWEINYDGMHYLGGYNVKTQIDSSYINTKKEFYAPLTGGYLSNFHDTSYAVGYAVNYNNMGFRAKIKSQKIKFSYYAGFGTLKLPNGTYNNVALLIEKAKKIDSIFIDFANNGNYTYVGPPQTSSSTYYQFMRNNTFGSNLLAYMVGNYSGTAVDYGWYTLPVDFGSISGTAFTSTTETTPITQGEAYLYRENSNFTKNDILAKAKINSSGYYNFDSIPYGLYRIAIRPDPALYPTSMITYVGDTTNWINALTITTTTLTSPGHNVHVKSHQAPSGTNNLHGQVMLNLGLQKSAIASMASNPIPGVGIVVKRNPGSSTARTMVTDPNGEFDLGTLENGGYVLFVDIPGMHMTGTYSFNVSGTSTISGLDYTAGTDSIHPNNSIIGIKELKNSAGGFMSAYPNPYTLNSTIAVNLTESDDITLEVYSVLGSKIQTLDKGMKNAGTYTYNFSAKKLNYSSGIYFVKLTVGNKTDVIKLIEE